MLIPSHLRGDVDWRSSAQTVVDRDRIGIGRMRSVNWGMLWAALPVIGAGGVMLIGGWTRRRRALVLAGTVCGSVGVMAAVSGWVLVADQRAGVAEALKTGGLAGASVVALYGLWLNDRRRRVEEERQQVEEKRLRVEDGRISHERFARAIELLGNDADQVRVGAMHALVGLARSTPSYTQTVLDVLCSYLRRPFHHRFYDKAHDPDTQDFSETNPGGLSESEKEDDRERQVRLTAKRLIRELLPEVGQTDEECFDLDLTGATVEYLDLAGRKVGGVLARQATLHGITRLAGAEFHGRVMFTGSIFHGRTDFTAARCTGGTSLRDVRFQDSVDLTGTTFRGFADLRWQETPDMILDGVAVDANERVKLAENWQLAQHPGAATGEIISAPRPRPHAADSVSAPG
jgi:uncharacterized protein YjbI with pentapeptide repeats